MSQLITLWHDLISLDVMNCPKTIMTRAIVEAIIEFCTKTEIFNYTINHTINENEPNEYLNYTIFIPSISTTKRPIKIKDVTINGGFYHAVFNHPYNNISELDAVMQPAGKKFYYFKEPTTTCLFPFKDSDFDDTTIEVTMAAVYVPVDSITEIDDEIYYRHRRAIENGAKAILMLQQNTSWANPQKAAWCLSEFGKAINKFRIRQNLNENNGEMYVSIPQWV